MLCEMRFSSCRPGVDAVLDLIRLSLLIMINLNEMREMLLFVCSKTADEILTLNCLLQIDQERSEEESSVGDVLSLAFL